MHSVIISDHDQNGKHTETRGIGFGKNCVLADIIIMSSNQALTNQRGFSGKIKSDPRPILWIRSHSQMVTQGLY